MKNSIDFLNGLRIVESKNFKTKVLKAIPENVVQFYIWSCGMKRASGYGSYNYFLDIEINGISTTLTVHSNSSPDWDYYSDLEVGNRNFDNWSKNTVLMILDKCQDEIIELIANENE